VGGSYWDLHSYNKDLASAYNGNGSCTGNPNAKNMIVVQGTIVSIDPDNLQAVVLLDFQPQGNLVGDFNQLEQNVTLIVHDVAAEPSQAGLPAVYSFTKGREMTSTPVTVDLVGQSSAYPWDSYTTGNSFGQDVFAVSIRRGLNALVTDPNVDACVSLGSAVGGWLVSPSDVPTDPSAHVASFNLAIRRGGDTRFYDYFTMTLMWALALGGVAMAVILVRRRHRREIDAGALTYLAALLFAFPLIRQTLPGDPGLGVKYDYVSYFWVEVIVALTLFALLLVWVLNRALPGMEDPPPPEGEGAIGSNPSGSEEARSGA
jgi:hypothetical protein